MSIKRAIVPAVLILALAAVAILLRGKGRLSPTPDAAVNLLFQAARRGDAAVYLSLLTGTLRSSFESTQSQIGSEAFAARLKESVNGMKGFAISPAGESSPDRTELEVELGFSDRNERQRFVLIRDSGGWLIERIDKADTVKPPIPYDVPIFDTGGSEPPHDPGKLP